MNAEQTKDDFLLQSSSNLRQKIVTWSGDYNWHQGNQCFSLIELSKKKKKKKSDQSSAPFDLFGERKVLRSKST